MLNAARRPANPGTDPDPQPAPIPERSRKNSFSTGDTTDSDWIASSSAADVGAGQSDDSSLPWLRINWEIKALVPIACVLLGGMLLFLLATLSWRDPERHLVLLVAGVGAVAICGALLVVLTYTVQRPMVELQ